MVIDPVEVAVRGGVLLLPPSRIALPPSPMSNGLAVYWVNAPTPARRWLPNLSTIVWALNNCTRPMGRPDSKGRP